MSDLLPPRTAAGVTAQVVAAAAVYVFALVAARRSPEFRRMIIGLATLTAAFFALRTLHSCPRIAAAGPRLKGSAGGR